MYMSLVEIKAAAFLSMFVGSFDLISAKEVAGASVTDDLLDRLKAFSVLKDASVQSGEHLCDAVSCLLCKDLIPNGTVTDRPPGALYNASFSQTSSRNNHSAEKASRRSSPCIHHWHVETFRSSRGHSQ